MVKMKFRILTVLILLCLIAGMAFCLYRVSQIYYSNPAFTAVEIRFYPQCLPQECKRVANFTQYHTRLPSPVPDLLL